ncbi:LacI family DNA-binding transcriptional regulator [Pseudoflavonifractor sp. MSJ-37]|uniref:LacI family DNA-binding transcriptional regulator n=1 Tax=Pseudoflavonifractor sp. MSJ-37 TaxID=2841531 RepID=UPI001C103A7D|nr:LacI family DNA-binding transcriptional regulator [Pseudoflavonifractor sp. MSJ-37]MBU5435773.1 LacI family transcriptional regulator [Pseudoflavonifractor sp. MSJ-37]
MNIKEIAKLTGVSVATVSRCINQPEKVSPETRARILEVIRKTDYVPNPSAQSLSTGQTRTIACVVPTLRNEFFNQLVEGSQKVLAQANYRVLVYSQSLLPRQSCPDDRSVDGMILYVSDFSSGKEVREYLRGIKVPYVLIGDAGEMELEQPVTSVYMEDYEGILMALRYLYTEGNRVFGILMAAVETFASRRRAQAVHDFFVSHPDCICRTGEIDYADQLRQSVDRTRRFLEEGPRPTAIVTFNDMMAVGALRCLHSGGIRVPEEMELIGFDDIPLASYFTPALSTIAVPNRRLGEKAAELLLRRLSTGADAARCVLYPVELRLRESTRNLIHLGDV